MLYDATCWIRTPAAAAKLADELVRTRRDHADQSDMLHSHF